MKTQFLYERESGLSKSKLVYGVYQLVRAAPLQKTEGMPMRKKGRKKETTTKEAQERGLCILFIFVRK